MHPLRTILAVSFFLAIVVATAFGFLLSRVAAGPARLNPVEIVGLSGAVFAVILIPWAAVTAWAFRRAGGLEMLTERAHRIAGGAFDEVVADREFHGELDDLARNIEEMRQVVIRQRRSFDEQRATMQQILAGLGEGLIAVSSGGRIVFSNRRAAEIFGRQGDLSGRSFLEIVQRQPFVRAIDRALGGEASSDRSSIAADGGERQIEIRVFPLASSEIAAVALFIDMTTVERLQRVRRDFLDDFSHEVRTPLAGLRSAAESFDQGPLPADTEEHLRRIMLRQIGRIERLVRDIAELNRIESGELALERRPIDLGRLLEELCDDFAGRPESRNARIVFRGEPFRADLDATRVQQIVSNLMDNALTHGGGEGEVAVELSRGDGEAIVRVSDEGEGIPPLEIERIFHRFYRVDRSRSQERPGLGLGLAITKHLVLLHGGTIRAENRAGGGALFEVRLPV
jgi:two-component system, OmpR family, phosphate regulon sensor histidine kinase PhoR